MNGKHYLTRGENESWTITDQPYMPNYRYGVFLYMANLGEPIMYEPGHAIMVKSLADVRVLFEYLKRRLPVLPKLAEMGDGSRVLDIPGYVREGDGALIFQVDPDRSEVIDEPGDRARHAFHNLLMEVPTHRVTIGVKGGYKLERLQPFVKRTTPDA